MTEIRCVVAGGSSPDTLALLQTIGAIGHEIAPFNVWGPAARLRRNPMTPRPSASPSLRPMDGETSGDELPSTCEDEYVEVIVDDESDVPAGDRPVGSVS